MANTIQLKRRIKTAKNVSKTTKAMQMIAASKLKRAQEATLSSRPYVEKLTQLSQQLTQRVTPKDTHPYMQKDATSNKTLLIVISPDKGLCGGLITNLLKEYLHFFKDETIYLVTLGKKVENVATRSHNKLVASFPFGITLPRFNSILPLVEIINEYFLEKKVDTVKILYTKFNNFFTQAPVVSTLLPIQIPDTEKGSSENFSFELYEPTLPEMLPILLKHYIEMVLYQHLLESFVSEQAARMLAMQNATDNAKDIIFQLTLEYNKARQTKITNEILDITSSSAFAN